MSAAGALIFARDTKKFLLGLRSANTKCAPNTWSEFGGKIDEGETPIRACLRELHEELGVKNHYILIPHGAYEKNPYKPGFVYHGFVGITTKQFEPKLNREHDSHTWVAFGKWPQPLHPSLAYALTVEGFDRLLRTLSL